MSNVKRSLPPVKHVKFSGDGGSKGGKLGLFGISRMLHDHDGNMLKVFASPTGMKNSNEAEFFAVGEGFIVSSYLQNIICRASLLRRVTEFSGLAKLAQSHGI